jgi:branched-chain amino acid transport system ATP-binding protein
MDAKAVSVLLETRALSHRFGAVQVTRDVHFRLEAGSRHALIGPNGAGKSTFINLLTGVLRPTSGTVMFKMRNVTGMDQAQRVRMGLARTFQINQLFRQLTVLENVCLAVAERVGAGWKPFRPMGCRTDILQEAMGVIETVQLSDVANVKVSELAYGRQRLVELAIALGLKPEVLLLDEPAAGVSSSESHLILNAIDLLPATMGVLIVDHDMELIFRFASRITVLVGGAIFAEGTAKEIATNPDVAKVYLGQSAHGHS